jgi:nucleotide-binding universal stress UspA family protein
MFCKVMSFHDLSPASRRALEWAVGWATVFRSRLKIVHVDEWSVSGGEGEAARAAEQRIHEDVEDAFFRVFPGRLEKGPADLEIAVGQGRPVPALLKAIEDDSPDLVVLGTHGRTDLPYVLMGSVAEKIVRHSPAPVLVLRRRSICPPRSALVPVDFSPSVGRALSLADAVAETLRLKLSLLHVVPPAPSPAGRETIGTGNLLDGLAPSEKTAAEQMDLLCAARPSVEASYCLSGEPVAEAICRTAAEIGTDLILIPTHRRAGLGRFLLGGVAEQVVRYAPCAVLSFSPTEGGPDV